MSGLADVLKDAYSADERRARARTSDPRRTISAIRRRRMARAAGTGTAAVAGVAAVGTVWWLAPGGRYAEPAIPAPSYTCEVWPYVPANAAATGDEKILFRVYTDLRSDSPDPKVVVVLPDGTAIQVEPNEAGDYIYTADGNAHFLWWHDMGQEILGTPSVADYRAMSSGGDNWDGVSPFVRDYAWTVTVPVDVPAGINTESLSSTLRIAMGMGGTGYITEAVPFSAVTDAVVTTTSGATEVTRLKSGDPGPSLEGRDDVASVALRVTGLPDGETFEIVATYDASDVPAPVCVSDEHTLSTHTSSPAPTFESSEPSPTFSLDPSVGISQGPSVAPSQGAEEEPMFGSSPTPAPSQG